MKYQAASVYAKEKGISKIAALKRAGNPKYNAMRLDRFLSMCVLPFNVELPATVACMYVFPVE